MLAEERLREGDLDESLRQLQEQVRKAPADSKLRVFLFQLLALRGEWDRAMTQLNVAGELDAGTLAMVQTYREALRCEVLRAEIFAEKK
jgi:type VI secretion system protein ImpE